MLYKKMLRDFKDNKAQFISIFFMAFIAVFAFAGIGAEVTGLTESSQNYYTNTNLADITIYTTNIDNTTIQNIENINGIQNTEQQLIIPTTAKLNNTPDITLHTIEKGEISKFYPISGEDFNINDENGIWLDKRFADANNLKIGDNITLEYGTIKITKEIKGIGYSPDYVYEIQEGSLVPDFKQVGYAYISYKAFPTQVPYNTLLIDAENTPNLENNIKNTIGENNYTQYLEQKDFSSYHQFQDEIGQHQMLADVMPMIFVIVSLLTLLTTMTRLINNQRTQIGTLKALGYSNKSVTLHYISYGFFLSTIGSILGIILGPMIIPYMFFPSMQSFYTLPTWQPGFNITFLTVAIIMITLSTLITYISIRNINKESPAQTIKPKPPKNIKQGPIEKSKIWKHLNFNIKWNFRDAKRNKVRSIMSIFGVLACTVILLASFGAGDSMEDVKQWQYSDINHYNTKLTLEDNITQNQLDNILNNINAETIMEDTVEIRKNTEDTRGTITVINDTKLITPTDENRQAIDLPNTGVAISSKIAETLNIKQGDTISWHISSSDIWVNLTVTQIYTTPVSQGIIISQDAFEKTDLNYTPTSIITEDTTDTNYTGVKSTTTMDSMINTWEQLTETMMSEVYVLIIFAIALSVVVLYNLGLLSFTEIKRELATLKVLGFKSKTLRRILLTQNLWFSLIGFLIGIPIGKLTLVFMMSTVGQDYYFPGNIYLPNLLITFLITFGVSIAVNLAFSRKIKNVNMVESLKDVE